MKIIISRSGISDIVYHATTLQKLLPMLQSGNIELTPSSAIGADSEVGNKYPFFLSTTRSRVGSYHRSDAHYNSSNSVLLTLDGRALKQTYAGAPVDYWGPDYRKRDAQKNEMEDRVYSLKNTIPLFKFLKGIDLLSPDITEREMRQMRITCTKHHIQLRVYSSGKDWMLGTKNQAAPTFIDKRKSELDWYPEAERPARQRDLYRLQREGEPRIAAYTKLLSLIKKGAIIGNVPNSIMNTTDDKELSKIFRSVWSDGASSLGADMHNAARKQGTKEYTQLVALINVARSLKLKPDSKSICKFVLDTMNRQYAEYKATLPQEDDGW